MLALGIFRLGGNGTRAHVRRGWYEMEEGGGMERTWVDRTVGTRWDLLLFERRRELNWRGRKRA